ncbi:MAG: alpha-amylase family glycosyl hydrolase [Myxococcota bacterium]
MTILAMAWVGCASDCLGPDCDQVPDVPWTPGDLDPSGETYGGDGDDDDGPVETTTVPDIVTTRSCDVIVRHKPPDGVGAVEVAGEWDGWTPTALGAPDADGFREVNLGALAPGEYGHRFVYDGVYEGALPVNVYTRWDGTTENRDLRVGDCTVPLLQTVSAAATPDGRVTATFQFATASDATPIDPGSVVVTVGDEAVAATVGGDGVITVDATGLAPGKHSVRLWAADTAGRHAENEPVFVPLWVEQDAWDWQDGTMYLVFVDRFRNGDAGFDLFDPIAGVAAPGNYRGGDFQGVIDAIEDGYFDTLGVDVLWLSPVYENPNGAYLGTDGVHQFSGYHGYWPTDPLAIEERSGDASASAEDQLDALIAAAHARGIRVLFDLVLNHVHEDHTYVQEHPDWFGDGCICGTAGCEWEVKPVECWFTGYLPDLNYKNDAIKQRVVADTLRLVEQHDVDAVRIDAAKHMDHVIMRTLSMRLRDDYELGGGAPFWLVGETFTDAGGQGQIMNYVNDWELDGQFDFPLLWAIRDAFVGGRSFRDLEARVAANEAAYGDAVMSPFLGNHDLDRFASAVDGQVGDFWNGQELDPMAQGTTVTEWNVINRLSLAFAFTLTQPGVPLMYYGDEIGLHGGGDPDNRRMMMFEPDLSANQTELLDRVRAMGQARYASEALRRGARVQLWVDDDVLVYARDNGGGDVAIVAMNKGATHRDLTPDVSALGIDGVSFVDATGGAGVTASGGQLPIGLDSWQYAIWVRP